MALLLKKDGRNTIKNKLSRYMRLILGIAFLELVCFFLFHGISVRQYQRNMEKVLSLNEFFDELDANYRELYLYIMDNDKKALDKRADSDGQLQKDEEVLQNLQISEEFTRSITDFAFMLRHYEDLETLIWQKMQSAKDEGFTPQLLGETVSLYQEAGKIYDLMIAQYKDLHLMMMNTANDVQKKLNVGMMRCYVVIIILVIAFVMFSVFHASRLMEKIVEPIQTLTTAVELVRSKDISEYEDVVIEQSSYGEIVTLVMGFNTMIHQLKNHIQVIEENARTREALQMQEMENLRITSLLKASELKALQMQMNPHFLFNTLNIISRTADQGDTDRTVLLLQKTAQLLRYNLDYSGRTVTLIKEIEMLGNYVFLQEQRFGSRIFFDFDLDERFHQIQIPSFILQPLVENAVIHGLGQNVGNGEVVIRTLYMPKEGKGQISILDNGQGMTEETRQIVQQRLDLDEEQREKIGLANVNMRMKMLFGENYLLEIFSSPGEGTEIRITLSGI